MCLVWSLAPFTTRLSNPSNLSDHVALLFRTLGLLWKETHIRTSCIYIYIHIRTRYINIRIKSKACVAPPSCNHVMSHAYERLVCNESFEAFGTLQARLTNSKKANEQVRPQSNQNLRYSSALLEDYSAAFQSHSWKANAECQVFFTGLRSFTLIDANWCPTLNQTGGTTNFDFSATEESLASSASWGLETRGVVIPTGCHDGSVPH